MSESKNKALDPEELVEFAAPLDLTGSRRDILLAVNGETVRVRRGSTVRLKRKFLEVWENANAQAQAARDAMDEAQERGKAPGLEL